MTVAVLACPFGRAHNAECRGDRCIGIGPGRVVTVAGDISPLSLHARVPELGVRRNLVIRHGHAAQNDGINLSENARPRTSRPGCHQMGCLSPGRWRAIGCIVNVGLAVASSQRMPALGRPGHRAGGLQCCQPVGCRSRSRSGRDDGRLAATVVACADRGRARWHRRRLI